VKHLLTAIVTAALLSQPSLAQAGDDAPGRWRFKLEDRPVKAVIVGGSVSAWPRGGYGQFLQAACSRVEIVNRGKARLGAKALRRRLTSQVFKNRRIDLGGHEATWLIFHGGLNSISTPLATNRQVARALKAAHDKGMKTIGLTVGPWGSEGDKRWRRAGGLRYRAWTALSVEFLMGRLSAEEAFGPSRAGSDYAEGERPDVAVDIYDSLLRDAEAPLRENARMARFVKIDDWVKRTLKGVEGEERQARLATFTEEALGLPRWYMKRELHAFDHVHPGIDGHRVIAQTMCPKLPEAWGCACDTLPTLVWDRKARGLVVGPQAAP
jgi:hypothetical protein